VFNTVLKKVLGTKHQREVKRMQPMVAAISALEDEIKKLSDAELRAKTAEFRQQLRSTTC
jgi:preprotein translocase subunit SecA